MNAVQNRPNASHFADILLQNIELGKASWKCGFEESYLDFSRIPEDSPLKDSISEYTWLGSLGEAYSPVMAILFMAYRVWQSPETLYDGMIYISKAHPTKIMPEQ